MGKGASVTLSCYQNGNNIVTRLLLEGTHYVPKPELDHSINSVNARYCAIFYFWHSLCLLLSTNNKKFDNKNNRTFDNVRPPKNKNKGANLLLSHDQSS